MIRSSRKEINTLIALLFVVGLLLTATAIRGPFTIDEVNYLVTVVGLREGTLAVPGTEGLHPSKELFSFDPEAYGRIASAPVFSIAPPLYAPIALPFLLLGWRGLVLLNTLSYLLTALIIFFMARHYAAKRQTPWIAAALTLFGGFAVEYSQGLWPHMLSVFLVTLAVFAARNVWEGGSPRTALICGLLMGVATGVREQNIILACIMGMTLLLFGAKKIISSAWFALGASIPLGSIAAFHFVRRGVFHPFPKVIALSDHLTQSVSGSSAASPLRMFWARVVDFSAFPPITDSIQSHFYKMDLASGVVLVGGVVKKALIQSSPWVALGLVILILSWSTRSAESGNDRRILRILSLFVLPFLLIMTLISGERLDGLCYNQRYFLEIMPLMALVLALALDWVSARPSAFIIGLIGSGVLFAMALMLPSRSLREIALLRIPLALALLLVLVWFFRSKERMAQVLLILVSCSVAWGLFVHVSFDLSASRMQRAKNAAKLEVLESTIPDHSALFAYWGAKDAAGPLVLSRDVVVLDVMADEGADAARLARELRLQNRRVFVLTDVFPEKILNEMVGRDSLVSLTRSTISIDEIIEQNHELSVDQHRPK
jgi:hypothetical protein